MSRYAPASIQLNRAEGFDYEGRATIKLQAGITLQSVALLTNLVTRSTLKKMAIDVNGSEIVYASGPELDYIDQVLKNTRKDGVFVLDLARFEYRSMAGIRQKELVTLPTDDVTLIIELGAKDPADPATPTVTGFAYATNNQSDRYFIPSMYRLTQNIAAAGDHEFIFPNSAPNRWIQRMCFKEDNAAVSKLEVYRGTNRIFEGSREWIDYTMERFGKRAIVAGYFVFEPTLFGFGSHGSLNTGTKDNLKFKLTVDAPGAMQVVVEGYEQVKQIPTAATA